MRTLQESLKIDFRYSLAPSLPTKTKNLAKATLLKKRLWHVYFEKTILKLTLDQLSILKEIISYY